MDTRPTSDHTVEEKESLLLFVPEGDVREPPEDEDESAGPVLLFREPEPRGLAHRSRGLSASGATLGAWLRTAWRWVGAVRSRWESRRVHAAVPEARGLHATGSFATRIAAGLCCAVWAVAGAVFWLPVLVRGIVRFSVALPQAMLEDRRPREAGRRLRAAVSFYARGFSSALSVARGADAAEGAPPAPERVEGGRLLRETGWALLVWYPVLLAVGLVEWSPLEVWNGMLSGSWPGFTEFVGDGIARGLDGVFQVAARVADGVPSR